jgi:DNA polymerase-1
MNTPSRTGSATAPALRGGASKLPPAGDPRTLYLIDISGYLFRAYHALPPLNNTLGEPTHAVLGTTTMIQKLMTEHRPQLLAVAMDSRTPSFRHALYEGYKANRPPAPPDLKPQIARVQQVIAAYHLPVLQQDGVEADDLIASAVARARAADMRVVIVSSDKDLMQLIDEHVVMFDTMRNAVFGPAEVEEKLGIPPALVRDYLALVGDSSDNIPGVPSVGPKTAVQLLREYGSLAGVYESVDKVERKALRQKLIDHRAAAELSRELVALKHDLDVDISAEALALPAPDVVRLAELFKELAFDRLVAQLAASQATAVPAGPRAPASGQQSLLDIGGEAVPAASATVGTTAGAASSSQLSLQPELAEVPAPPAEPVPVILEQAALDALAGELAAAERIAVLCLMEGEHPVSGRLVGLGFAHPGGAAYVPLVHEYLGAPVQLSEQAVLAALRPVLESERPAKVCSDAKVERMVLLPHGVALAGVTFDAMLASYLIDPERHNHRLAEIVRFELQSALSDEAKRLLERRAAAGTVSGVQVERAADAAGEVLRATLRAREVLAPMLDAVGCAHLLQDIELPLARVLCEMELTGVRVDTQRLAELSGTVQQQLVGLEARCRELAGHDFNVGSPRQLETILFDELKLPVVKRTKTARSTDADVLEELAGQHPLPAAILEHRLMAKLESTYLQALPRQVNARTGRIHTDFRQAVAATGRLSSTDPNLQNIPIRTEIGRSIRGAFVAREGWQILSADYSQIELRVLAHLSKDAALCEAFAGNTDVHARTARAIFGVEESAATREQRGQAKTVNYAVIYGQTQFALARNLRIERSEAARYIKAFFEQYAGVARYMQTVVHDAMQTGETRTLCGRIRKLPDLQSRDRMKRQAAERVARNTPIQGSAADIIKLAMIAIAGELALRGMQSKMLLTVHDELVFEAPAEEKTELEAMVRDRMANAFPLDVPLVADAGWGHSWGDAH